MGRVTMHHRMYTFHFQGPVNRAGIDGNVWQSSAAAQAHLNSCAGNGAFPGSSVTKSGNVAAFNLEMTFTSLTTFQEAGTIVFDGDNDRLHVSTVGNGHLVFPAEGSSRRGAAILEIVGGEGAFAGSAGLIVSNFVVSEAGALTDHHLGLISIAEGGNRDDE
jgi:hypothetical protein